ncbi:MAG: TonB-dependent receptor [Chitinophagales bacterium]
MKHILLFLFFTLTFFIFSDAQNATLKGKVLEPNGEGVIQANVIIDVSKGWAVATDFEGNYELNVPAGKYAVLYRYIGKIDKIVTVTLKANETTIQNVTLDEKAELINTIVVTASKYAKKLSEETVSIEVLSNDLLENNNIVDAEESLNKVPGVTVTEGQANIRGGSGWSYGAGSRVAVLYDDLPMVSAEGGDAKWGFIPMENVEQIEVIKGAASSIYGSGALNGVINVRTGYAKKEPETKISIFGGAYASPINYEGAWWLKDGNQTPFEAGASLLHKRKVGQLDLVVHGQYNQKRSTFQGSGNSQARGGFKFRFRPKKVQGLNLGINTNISHGWGRNFFLWDGDYDKQRIPMPGTSTNYQSLRWTIDPFINYRDKKGNRFSYKFRYFNTTNKGEQGQGSVPTNYYNELQYTRYFKKIKFNIVAGLVGSYSTVRAVKGSDGTLTGEFNSFNLAPYFQLEKKLFADRLNLTFGARYEYFNLKSINFDVDGLQKTSLDNNNKLIRPLFRGGANFRAAKATFIRASFGEGYRFPSIAESFVNLNLGGIQVFPNPNLKAETGWYGEVGVKQGFKVKNWQGYADAAFFITRYQNMIEANFGQFGDSTDDLFGLGFSFQNVGNTQIWGADFSFASQGKIGNFPLQILFGYTFTQPTSLDWDEQITLYNKSGDQIKPGQILYAEAIQLGDSAYTNIDISGFLPEASNGRKTTYAGTSTSEKNILKYRSRHVLTLDAQSTYKRFDFGISFQFQSKFENIDYFFSSPFLTDEITNPIVLDELQDGSANAFLGPDDKTMEEGIGTNAFSGIRSWEERTANRVGNALLGARVTYRFSDNASISLIGKNLLNTNYTVRPAIMGDPLKVQIKFSYSIKHKPKTK